MPRSVFSRSPAMPSFCAATSISTARAAAAARRNLSYPSRTEDDPPRALVRQELGRDGDNAAHLSLSNIGPGWFFMSPRLPVIGCRPFFQSRAKRFLRYRPCRPTASPPAPRPCSPVAPIIGIARCDRDRHQRALVVHHHMQFDPEDPYHRRMPARDQVLEHPVATGARVGADRQSGAVGDMDASLFAGNRMDQDAERGVNATNRPYEGSSPKQSRCFRSTPCSRKRLKSLKGDRWNNTMTNSVSPGESLPDRRRLHAVGISRCRSHSSKVSAKSSRQQ